MILKSVLRREGFHDEIETKVAYYMSVATSEQMRAAWKYENLEQQISLKKGAEKAMRKVEVTVSFDEKNVVIGEESCTE